MVLVARIRSRATLRLRAFSFALRLTSSSERSSGITPSIGRHRDREVPGPPHGPLIEPIS